MIAYWAGEKISLWSGIPKYIRSRRLVLIYALRKCIEQLYDGCERVSYEEAKQLAPIVTLLQRINPVVQGEKQKEKQKHLKEMEEEEHARWNEKLAEGREILHD